MLVSQYVSEAELLLSRVSARIADDVSGRFRCDTKTENNLNLQPVVFGDGSRIKTLIVTGNPSGTLVRSFLAM